MPDVTSHAPGSFCWVELSTTDPKAAVAFYRALFGWDIEEHDMGPDGVYTMFKMRGLDVAAGYGQQAQEREARIPSHWNMYVSVTDADAAAAEAQSLGATVLAPPFDVMEHGRMAALQDPTGATFMVWQPKQHIGVRITGEPGALTWSELATRDPRRAETFYTSLFGWTGKTNVVPGGHEYTEFFVEGAPGIGMMPMPPDVPAQVPSYWMPYFEVASADTSAASALALGATTVVAPTDIPNTGRFAVLSDPTGAMFAIFERK